MTEPNGGRRDYHVVGPDEIEPTPEYPCDRRSITDEVRLATLAVARYELAPGEQLPRSYHYHEQREEIFYVCSGLLRVETPEHDYVLEEDELFVAKPGSPHRAYNPETASDPVTVLGVGAPRSDMARPYEPESDDVAET